MNTQRLVTALLFALSCSALFTWQISKHLQQPAPTVHVSVVRDVVVAAKDLHAGDPLSSASLTIVKWPMSQQIPGMFAKSRDLTGRFPLVPVSAGEPILSTDLATTDSISDVGASIPQGMRAVSIRAADDSLSSTGLLTSGSDIDVLVSYRSDADASFVSSTVLQDVRVLTIVQPGTPVSGSKLLPDSTITLLVTPESAARLTAASALGRLTFALRNRTDHDVNTGLSRVSVAGFSNPSQTVSTVPRSARTAKEKTAKAAFTIETLSGGKSSLQTFPGDEE